MVGLLAALALNPGAVLATSCTPAGPAVPGAPLPGSCFEGYDGDQLDSDGSGAGNDRLDWQSVTSSAANDFTSRTSDTQFGPGGSEETPDSWTFDFGTLGSDKYDIVSGWSAKEERPGGGDTFLALAFVRASNNGTTHLAFELNQTAPGYRVATETHSPTDPPRRISVPTRSSGDLLVTYSVDPPVIGLCTWSGSEHSGHWLDFNGNNVAGANCPQLPANLVQGALSATTITAANNFLQGNANSLDAKTFAEASLNLTQAVKVASGNVDQPCRDFGYLWLHSRSSISITSNQEDYILPDHGVSLSTCERTPPDTTIDSNPPDPTNSSSAEFSFSGTDTGSGVASFECKLDGSAFAACTSPQDYTGLGDGSHTFAVRAIDVTGNVDPTPASFTWMVANSAPTASVTGGQCLSLKEANGLLDLTLFDPDGDAMTLVLASNSNPALIPSAGILLGGSGNQRTLTVSAAPKRSGTASLMFNLSDGAATVAVVITVVVGTDKNETLTGTQGTDIVFGLGGNDTIVGSGGNDLLCGNDGKDAISGGDGNDILDGAKGDDSLSGDSGADLLRGSEGNDTLTGGLGGDAFSGGPGTDTYTDFSAAAGDTSDGT